MDIDKDNCIDRYLKTTVKEVFRFKMSRTIWVIFEVRYKDEPPKYSVKRNNVQHYFHFFNGKPRFFNTKEEAQLNIMNEYLKDN